MENLDATLVMPAVPPMAKSFGAAPIDLSTGISAYMLALGVFIPVWQTCTILFIGGMPRSMQFTALNTIAFADIPPLGLADANILFSTAFQLGMGMGISLVALAWQVGKGRSAHAAAFTPDATTPFRIAFLLVSAVSFAGLIDSFKLARDASPGVLAPTS